MATSLARCVGDTDRFLAEHWSRAPLHRRGLEEEAFADLLSLEDVDHIISASLPRLPTFRLVRDGKPLDPSRYTKTARLGGRSVPGVGDAGRIYEEFADGATIVLQGLHRYRLALGRFCRDLELELTHPAQANAYITPPGSRGLAVHYDTHDVFVLQVAGAKEWLVYEPVLEMPAAHQRWSSDMGCPDEPILTVELRPGDSLYIPRGFVHAARSREGVSAHLTIGIRTYTWGDVVDEVLRGLTDEVEFRRPLPVGFASDEAALASAAAERVALLRDWLEKVDVAAVAARVAGRFWSTRTPILAGQLQNLQVLDRIDDATTVRRREGAVCRIEAGPDRLVVVLGDRRLEMPPALAPVVGRVAAGTELAVGDLADQLDRPSRTVLVRRLVREGLLEVTGLG